MRKLRKVVPFGLAVMMSLQGIYPAVPVMADTVKVAAAKKTTSSATVLSKKERAKIMQQINAMSPEEGLKLAKKKGIIKEDTNAKESNLKKATVNKDAKEGEIGYQFTQDQYVDETHRIRYEYTVTAEGEVSAQYVKGIVYEDGNPKKENNKEITYDITDELTYPSQVTLNNTTYKVTDAATLNVKAKHLIIPEGVETCWDSSIDQYVEKMTIPSTLKKFDRSFYGHSSYDDDKSELKWKKSYVFKGYELSNPEKAKYISVRDGIVYNKEETEMVSAAPCALEKDVLTLPDTLKEIPAGSFKACKGIKKLVFGKNITSIGNEAFAYSNIENVQMNDNVTVLGEYAFYYCTKLANVDLSKSLTKIDGYETFKYTDALKHIDLKNVTELTGWYTFQQSGLEDVDLSNVESVDGVQVFGSCYDLKTVYIGKNTDLSSRLGIGCNCFVGCHRLEKYVQKEANKNNLYVEDGKLYASKITGYVALPDGDMAVKTLTGKILLGYPVQMQRKDSKNNNKTLKLDDDITGIGCAGLTTFAQYIEDDDSITTDEYCNKLIIPSSVKSIELVYTMPEQDLEIDIYGNEIPAIDRHCFYSVNSKSAEKEDAVLGTKTIKFKTAALRDEFVEHWKEHVMYIYKGEKEVYDVLPEKKTTSLTLNKTSDKILCDGTSHEIHLIAKLSEDDCTDVVTFKSSNEDLATVDGNGVVTTKANAHGSATITATAGDHTATYKLTQAGSGINVTADQKTIVYKEWWETENLLDNIKKSINVTCADCHNNLGRDKDYEVIVSDYKKTGKVDVTIKGIGAFEGMTAKTSVNVEYHKHGEEGYDIRNLYSGYNWTGKEVKPDVLIRCADCNKELKEGTDYKLEYENNVNVGTATVKVIGMGAYKGVDQTANFEIEEDCGWNGIKYYNDTYQNGDHIGSLEWSEWGYHGKTPYIPIACNHCGKELKNGKDYTITFSNTDHLGEGTAKVVGLNEYAGYELNFTYTLKAKDLKAESYYNGDDLGTYKWTGKEVNPDIGKIYVQDIYGFVVDTEAVEGKDYQLEYSNNIEEGTATVKVVGIGDAKGTVLTYTYHIEKQHGWNGFSVTGHKDGDDLGAYEWTGNNVEPELNLTCNHCGNELYQGSDYELEYTGARTEPGKVTVKVIGTRDYEGWTQSFTYTIKNKTFSFEDHKDGEDLGSVEYTGSEVRYPISIVTDKTGKVLSEGTDYKLVYSDNTKPGVANVQIVGLNDYDGCTLSFTYTIVNHDGESGFHNNLYTDGADMGSYAYTGEEVKPSIGLMYSNYNQTFLIEGVDYKVEYSNNINPGTATAKVIGMGDYKGYELNFTFVIEKKAPTTTEDQKPTTTTTETKPTTSSTTTETKPATTETRPSTEDSSTAGTTAAKKETATTAAPVIRISVKKAAIQKIKVLKKAFTINILKNKDQVTGYQISYSYKKNFKGQKVKDLKKFKYKKIKVKRKKYTITSYKVKGLKKKKTVYVRVRAYKQVGKTKAYGKWSSVKKVKIK